MKRALVVFLRGLLIVTFVAWNVRHVAAGAYPSAFLTAFCISVLWWLNAGLAGEARQHKGLAVAYGLGAACGTTLGMWLGS